MAIDTGVSVCGLATIVKYKSADRDRYSIVRATKVKTSPSDNLEDRFREIKEQVEIVLRMDEATELAVEVPPDTIYGYKRLKKEQIVARAQSLFRTFGLAYFLIGSLRSQVDETHAVYPSQWEPSKKARNNIPIKQWSLARANILLKENSQLGLLSTSEEENIADAINLGWKLIHG